MKAPQPPLLVLATVAALIAGCASAQTAAPQAAASVPDFSGVWAHPSWPSVDPPLSGPGPVRNRSTTAAAGQPGGRRSTGSAVTGLIPVIVPARTGR